MNTPYPETIQPDPRIALFAEYNRGVERARAEYNLHPLDRCQHRPHCKRQTSQESA